MTFSRLCLMTPRRLRKACAMSHSGFLSRYTSSVSVQSDLIRIHPDVSNAVKRKLPVVALESTIITHGMPYPENYRTAVEVEDIVRQKNVVPATIAVINGIIHVGLTEDDLLCLATSKSTRKVSRRGLTSCVAFGHTGGTTVSATMLIAHWCKIPIFVTGGIGGVHRGAKETMDISSDLTELGRTPVTVVSAGVKSILDIPKTLEYLETQGVTVASFGDTDDFPAFFTPKSGRMSQTNVRNALDAAKLIRASQRLEMDSGCLIAVPIPERHAASGYEIDEAVQKSLAEAESLSISGAEVTPYILKRVNELTAGQSLKSNVALIKNNAAVGADIATELSKISTDSGQSAEFHRPVVIGATNIDIVSKASSDILYDGPSNPADINCTLGGVGRNIAGLRSVELIRANRMTSFEFRISESLSRLGNDPAFVTVLGSDKLGDMAENEMSQYLDTSFARKIADHASGMYVAVMDKTGSLKLGSENLSINDRFSTDIVREHEDLIGRAPLVCIDANLPKETICYICDLCKSCGTKLFYEPTGSLKADRPFYGNAWKSIDYLSPNLEEFQVILATVTGKSLRHHFDENRLISDDDLRAMLMACKPLLEHVKCLIVTLAKNGVVTFNRDRNRPQGIVGSHYAISSIPKLEFMGLPIKNVSGSGDSLAGAFLHGILNHESIDTSVKMGVLAAQLSLRAEHAVPPTLTGRLYRDVKNLDWTPKSIF